MEYCRFPAIRWLNKLLIVFSCILEGHSSVFNSGYLPYFWHNFRIVFYLINLYKNMKPTTVFFLAALLALTTSCKVTFTRDLRNKIETQGLDLKKIQYYNSSKITLRRILTNSETKVASGEVRLNNGVYIEEIEIKKNTPGICDSLMKDGMKVKFEQGEGRYLIFHANGYGEYQLTTGTPSGNQNNQQFYQTNNGEVIYEGKKYFINTMSRPKLKIKKKGSSEFNKKKRQASGVRVQ